MTTPELPRIAAAILLRAAPRHWREHFVGDLAEEFSRRHAASPLKARWWYRLQVLWVLLARASHVGACRPPSWAAVVVRIETDFFSAWRVLRRRPRFALVLVTVLGGSLGTSGTVLAIADAYLRRPLPYPSADRLVAFARIDGRSRPRAPRNQTALHRDGLVAEVAELAVTGDLDGFTIIDGATPTTVLGMWTGAELFSALGTRPVLGRT
jgi:hypothetical protein